MKTYIFNPANRLAQFEQEPRLRQFRKVSAGEKATISDERAAEVRAVHGSDCLIEKLDEQDEQDEQTEQTEALTVTEGEAEGQVAEAADAPEVTDEQVEG